METPNKIGTAIKSQKWVKSGTIIVPAYTSASMKQPKIPSQSSFAVYIPYSEIFGSKISENEIIETVKGFKVYDGVASASKLEITLENHGHFNKRIQAGLVVHLFRKEIQTLINEKVILDPDRFVFFEQQLLNAIKLSLLYGSLYKKRNFRNKDVFDSFLEKVLLGIGDYQEKEYEEEEKRVRGDRKKEVEAMIKMALRNMYFNSSEQYRYLVSRYYQMYFVIPKRRHLRLSENFIDLENECKRATSFSLDTYYCLGLGVLTQYALVNIDKGKLDPNKFFINKNVYFRDIKTNRREAVRFLNMLSITAKEFREEFPAELAKTGNFYYSFILMRKKPLVKANGHIYFASGLRFLKEKLTGGIFWDIFDSFDKARKYKMFRFFGEIFEEYVKDLFKRLYGKNKLTRMYFFEKEYGKPTKKTSDVMLCYPPEAIFIEANASRLRMVETAVAGKLASFREDLQKIVYNSAKQLNRVIDDFSEKQFELDGINKDHIHKIYPVILTLSPIPQADLIWMEEFEPQLKSFGYLQQKHVAKLQLIDIEEMEMIEALVKSGFNFKDILKNKVENLEYVYKPMKNYLLAEYFQKNNKDYPNKYLQSKFTHVSKLARYKLFGAPMSMPFPRKRKNQK